jgi:hypothetical protein
MNTKATSVSGQKPETSSTQSPAGKVQIKQEELVHFIGLKNQIEKLTEQKVLMETEFKNLLTSGATVEEGTHIAKAELSERRTPSWKEEFIALGDKLKGAGQGEKLAEKVIDNTEPVPVIRLTVR